MTTGTLRLYGLVGNLFAEDESITAKGVARDLDRLHAEGVDQLDIFLSSDGGSVMEGLAVHDQIKRFPGNVTMHVDGRAVSIASVIALAGRRLVMPRSAMMMVHAPFDIAIGNADELRKKAAGLDAMAATMRGIYCAASGMSSERVRKMMDDETWLTAEDAKKCGLVDEVTDSKGERAAAARTPLLDRYRNTPPELRAASAAGAIAKLEGLLMRQRIQEHARGAYTAATGERPGHQE